MALVVFCSMRSPGQKGSGKPLERHGSVVVSTSACHAGSIPGPSAFLGVKTWLSTLEIVYLCVFRMRH